MERSKSASPEKSQILWPKLKQDLEAGCITSKEFVLVAVRESVKKDLFSC